MPVEQVKRLSPASLAYVGDAVYELYVRRCYLMPPQRISRYHQKVVKEVKAETQAHYLQTLEPYLNSEEKEVARRGRNAATGKPKRVNCATYRQATGLETLIGYLYLTDIPRLEELLDKVPLQKIALAGDSTAPLLATE